MRFLFLFITIFISSCGFERESHDITGNWKNERSDEIYSFNKDSTLVITDANGKRINESNIKWLVRSDMLPHELILYMEDESGKREERRIGIVKIDKDKLIIKEREPYDLSMPKDFSGKVHIHTLIK